MLNFLTTKNPSTICKFNTYNDTLYLEDWDHRSLDRCSRLRHCFLYWKETPMTQVERSQGASGVSQIWNSFWNSVEEFRHKIGTIMPKVIDQSWNCKNWIQYPPGTQTTLVLVGKKPCFDGLTFKNRGQKKGSRQPMFHNLNFPNSRVVFCHLQDRKCSIAPFNTRNPVPLSH